MATERRNFTKEEIEATWKKAVIQPNNNPDVFRKDYAGAWIKKKIMEMLIQFMVGK